jgi:D-inositol-3-phosphate glycosyltransferase
MHTSPLAQPGTGDGGGMNVYVRELSTALARAGVECDVYTRAWDEGAPAVVAVEPGLRVHHVPAGPLAPVAKEGLPPLVEEFADGVLTRLETQAQGLPEAIHANYWLSGLAGHALKHRLELPLACTFHTLDRVKAEAMPDDVGAAGPARRAQAEAQVIDCSDAVLASSPVEADQLVELYGADRDRIEIVAPGVDHAFFAPGHRPQARRALGLPAVGSMLLFVGRIQPLKGADVAVTALAELGAEDAFLVVVGGPSGPEGPAELARLHGLARQLGVGSRVRFIDPQPHELLSTYYRAADVCLVPSRSESFGLTALEAAACGTPVVASAVGGLLTLVEHGRTGYLVEGRDPSRFAAYAAELVGNPERARAMGRAAAEVARRYTWPVAAGRLRRLYQDLTQKQLVEC